MLLCLINGKIYGGTMFTPYLLWGPLGYFSTDIPAAVPVAFTTLISLSLLYIYAKTRQDPPKTVTGVGDRSSARIYSFENTGVGETKRSGIYADWKFCLDGQGLNPPPPPHPELKQPHILIHRKKCKLLCPHAFFFLCLKPPKLH